MDNQFKPFAGCPVVRRFNAGAVFKGDNPGPALRIDVGAGEPSPIFWIAPNGDRYKVLGPDRYQSVDGAVYSRADIAVKHGG